MNGRAVTVSQMARLRKMVAISMRAQDDFVLRFDYRDKNGRMTRRFASPIKFVGHGENESFVALCLCREEVRQFVLAKCSEPVLVRAWEVLMPVEIETVDE